MGTTIDDFLFPEIILFGSNNKYVSERAQKFYELGADILFVEAPKSEDEMRLVCKEVPGYKLSLIHI